MHGEGDDGREESTGTILLGKALALVSVQNVAVINRARDARRIGLEDKEEEKFRPRPGLRDAPTTTAGRQGMSRKVRVTGS